MKKAVALCLAAVLVLSMTTGVFAEGRTFGVCCTTDSPFFTAMNDTIRAVLEINGDTVITLNSERDQAKQIAQISELIARGIDALFLIPVDGEGVTPALLACREAGIPVINLDAPIHDENLVACTVASDNKSAGRLCAEDLLHRVEGGKIAVLGNSTLKSDLERITEFERVIGMNTGFSIAARADTLGKRETAEAAMRDIIREFPDLAAVMCISDTVALWAVPVLKEAGMEGRVLIYGVNGSPEAKRAVRDGLMTGTAAQSARGIAHTAVAEANKVLGSKKVEKHTWIPTLIITRDNLQDFFIDGWQ
ncbi:MAG: sugar ABC transporter substrate-binding protein [Fretibacterium sp.]|nr:sugar ABC transporter substrate-binding protein [Fretibacterium sp.]